MIEERFWERKSLAEMSRAEWEALCDGCGRCCLIKLEDEDSGQIDYTDVACRLLDLGTCRCTDYANRRRRVPDCVKLTPGNLEKLGWMPSTCAYRLLFEGRRLQWWHPLVSGDAATVVAAGISVAGRVVSEREVDDAELEDRIVSWPA